MSGIQGLTIAVGLATTVALVARQAGALNASGALAAAIVGTCAMVAGWGWGVVLVAYFVSSSALSRVGEQDRALATADRVDKHGPRDAAQVVANGGMFALAAVGYRLHPHPLWQALGIGALAASAADTWATELGTLARATPRSILTWRPVPVGTSGGVTMQGFGAGIAGAALLATLVWALRWPASTVVAAMIGGIAGCLLDSVVGASLQARRWCATCRTATEQRLHRCGTMTDVTGGISWLNNDGVNVIGTIGGALFGAAGSGYF